MNKICFLLLIMNTFCVHSKSWNEVFSENINLRFDEQAPMLINNKIVFKTETEDEFGLWSYDLETNQKSNLIPPDVGYELNDVIQLGDAVYFLIKRFTAQPYFQLWKTDGDLYGTRKISDLEFRTGYFKPSLVVYGNTLFARGDNGAIIEVHNDEVFSHQVQMYEPYLTRMCVFKEQDFILFDVYNNDKVVRITEGAVTDITDSFPDGFFIRSALKSNNNCYFNYTVYENRENTKNILKISETGEITSFRESDSLKSYYTIIGHNNNKYAFRDDPVDGTSSIVQLAEDDMNELNVFKLTGTSSSKNISTNSLLFIQDYVRETNNDTQYLLNDQLQLIEKTSVPWNTAMPRVQRLMNSDSLIFNNDYSLSGFEIKVITQNGNYSDFNSKGFVFINAISSNINDKSYFVLKNRETGVKSLFSLDDKPNIGTSLNGIWHDPNLKNQGLFIKQGTRFNRSTYLSTTMYTFRDDKPLWLAGNADFLPNQDSIEISLFDFRGTEFLELVEEPVRNDFGTIKITPLGCNKLQAIVSNETQIFELNLRRIDNTAFKKYCLEDSDQPFTK